MGNPLNSDNIFNSIKNITDVFPHLHSISKHQFDMLSFTIASAALGGFTYNTILISNMDAKIEAQDHKTNLLVNITNFTKSTSSTSLRKSTRLPMGWLSSYPLTGPSLPHKWYHWRLKLGSLLALVNN